MEKALTLLTFIVYFIALFAVSIFDGKQNIKISLKNKLVLFSIYILTYTYIAFSIYLNWTPVGLKEILGIQSRYFIPILPIFLLLFYNNKFHFKKPDIKVNTIIFVTMAVILSVSALLCYIRYYII